MKHKLMSLCLVLVLAFAMPLTAAAAEFDADRLGSVSVTLLEPNGETPIEGVELALYHVASVTTNGNGQLSYSYLDDFAGCGVPLDDLNLPTVLNQFVVEHAMDAQKAVTDGRGTAAFGELPLGLYFVKQTNRVEGYSQCRPFLVTVPNQDESGFVYDVNASPKTEIEKLTDITIKKVWNTDETVKIADYVTVELLRDGILVETTILNKDNNWKEIYPDMPVSDGYTIKEIDVPKGFTATYSQNGYDFTVTNTATLIQTGQLVWPIPVLALIGLTLIAVGVMVLRKARYNNG